MPSSKFNPDEQYEEETLTIVDESGRSLPCYIEQSLEIDNMTYLLLVPVDIPVVIMSINSDSEDEMEASMLDDEEAIALIFDNAKAVLAEQNLLLHHTGYTLTAIGELPPIEEDQILTLDADGIDDDIEEEELQSLAHFYHAGQKYGIYTPLTPLLFFARYDAQNRLELVSPDQDDLMPILEELLSED
ncbi:DUF3727 domain-containing protein [Waterburya agarophytonicola K14]|uniref:DUF3727 domain-containing protein n=1 Tax=Waterburya agarophytonicola KI4 TaxID=2874699 RepID=A0A964BSE1_9CYAN|nr:DUF3727 domain-containing protein [Waterburya agarophytonicola]MCC0176990.1 DUF3727 domain-containing protein [Waterburya agarophytonicola KI4]